MAQHIQQLLRWLLGCDFGNNTKMSTCLSHLPCPLSVGICWVISEVLASVFRFMMTDELFSSSVFGPVLPRIW